MSEKCQDYIVEAHTAHTASVYICLSLCTTKYVCSARGQLCLGSAPSAGKVYLSIQPAIRVNSAWPSSVGMLSEYYGHHKGRKRRVLRNT